MKNHKIKYIILFVLITASIFACNGQNSNKHEDLKNDKITQFNYNAMAIVERNIYNKLINKDSLYLSLSYLDSAISLDSESLISYSNKAKILIDLGRLDDALLCLNKINKMNDENRVIIDQQIGFIYLKLNDSLKSRSAFLEAYKYQQALLKKKPELQLSITSNLAFLKLLIENKEAALIEIDKVIEKNKSNPKIQIALDVKNAIETFNLSDYLNDIFPRGNEPK